MQQEIILNVNDIMELIPHRYPMLLIDKLKILNETSAIGYKNVTFNELYFQGHFPNAPIMPGVMIVEAMAQSAGAFSCYQMSEKSTENLVYFTSIGEAKFRKPVTPGDVIEFHIEMIQSRKMLHKYRGAAKVNSQLVTEAIFSAMIVSKKDHLTKIKK